MAQPIHQEVVFDASPERVYEALTDSGKFSQLSGGAPTEIDPEVGGSFSCFGGMIQGRNVELVPNQRIAQAWRVGDGEPGVYSIAKFELKPEGCGTRLVLAHAGFPEGQREHLESAAPLNYWERL